MRRIPTVATAVVLLALLAGAQGCTKRQPGQSRQREGAARLRLAQMTDEQKLLLFEHLPLRVSLADVKDAVPDLSPQRLVGTPGGELTSAGTGVDVLGHRTRVEFGFRDDTLYVVTFGPVDLPADSGDALFARLNEFYSHRLGAPLVGDGQDSPYYVKSRYWRATSCEVGLANSLAEERRILGWGYQPITNTPSSP